MANTKEIIKNIEHIYNSDTSLSLLKDFERVLDELNLYVYENWIDGELVEGPNETRYYIECTFMWPEDKMPEPRGGKILLDYGCNVQYAETQMATVRKIKKPEDIRPGTRKGKIDFVDIWLVKITIPKKLIYDIESGYTDLDRNKIADMEMNTLDTNVEPDEEMGEDMSDDTEQDMTTDDESTNLE